VTLSRDEGGAVVPFRKALPTWIRVALLSFGGPAGQIAVMHRLLVEERKWVREDRFLHAMSYCMLLPGPEAQQLATYIGWLLHGWRGGLVAGLLFILPGFASIYALSILYAGYHDTALFAALFFGLKPAVIAVVAAALVRMGRRALTTARNRVIAPGAFIAIFFLGVRFPVIVLGAGIAGYLLGASAAPIATAATPRSRPSWRATLRCAVVWLAVWWVPVALLAVAVGGTSIFVREALFFSRAAVVTFGGAYAVLAWVAQKAVESYHWLLPGEMLDGLGMAETTPGPLIQVVQFVGFMGATREAGGMSPLLAGTMGALVTTWVTFAPCFLFVFVGAPWAEHLRGAARLNSALSSITAAIVGVILNLGVWFALHTLFAHVAVVGFGPVRFLLPEWSSVSWISCMLALGATTGMIRYRTGMMPTLAITTLLGFLFSMLHR
jgi:chromate transporter